MNNLIRSSYTKNNRENPFSSSNLPYIPISCLYMEPTQREVLVTSFDESLRHETASYPAGLILIFTLFPNKYTKFKQCNLIYTSFYLNGWNLCGKLCILSSILKIAI